MPGSPEMNPDGLDRHPFLGPYRRVLSEIPGLPTLPDHATLDACFARARAARFPEEPELRFVDCPPKTRRRRKLRETLDPCRFYDGRITRDREVPTRLESVHDFHNALVWLAFPRTKRAIHARQFAALERWIPDGARTIPGKRTREQDALTLFDEGGAVLLGGKRGAPIGELEPGSTLLAFGHALLEHFQLRTTPIAATALVIETPLRMDAPGFHDELDRLLAARVEDASAFLEPGLDALVLMDASGGAKHVGR